MLIIAEFLSQNTVIARTIVQAILFVCLVFTLTAPSYIWSIIGV